jgi:hypothetical protein
MGQVDEVGVAERRQVASPGDGRDEHEGEHEAERRPRAVARESFPTVRHDAITASARP